MSHVLDQIEVFAPATVANLTVGFDCLGCALEEPLERLIIRRSNTPGVKITAIHGADLPHQVERNVSSRAALSVLELAEGGHPQTGVELEIFKTVLPGSGIGSSSASAASAAFAVNQLLGSPLKLEQLLEPALDGEFVASGARHADNVAAALFGGLCLVGPDGVVNHLPVPDWHIAVAHPQIEIRTLEARAVLPAQVELSAALQQMSSLARFTHLLHKGDPKGAALCLTDTLVEAHRIPLQPHYSAVRQAALTAGAWGGGISGSGPSTFWVCRDRQTAEAAGQAIAAVFNTHEMPHALHLTRFSPRGAHTAS
ncbi:MAG: homoserine kinase [Flavobacteriales bacterium]|nr:homoserine kinase [Flavobacteriales bacterium]